MRFRREVLSILSNEFHLSRVCIKKKQNREKKDFSFAAYSIPSHSLMFISLHLFTKCKLNNEKKKYSIKEKKDNLS